MGQVDGAAGGGAAGEAGGRGGPAALCFLLPASFRVPSILPVVSNSNCPSPPSVPAPGVIVTSEGHPPRGHGA